jgi:biotin operon repressor
MNAFKLLLLLSALVAVMNIPKYQEAPELVKLELIDGQTIPRSGTLIIPTMLKWDDVLVDSGNIGVITLRVKEMRFMYERSPNVNRNEYVLISPKAEVEIGVKAGDLVEVVFVDGEVVLHEILPPRIPVEPVVREKRERKVAEKITYSSYEMQDIEMPASLFKLWHILKQQTSNWHTEEKLASVTGYSKKKVRMCLRELRDMEKIELETSTQGIKITLRSYLC